MRRFLLVWDPIGVADTGSDDEYDFVLSPLMRLLYEGADEPTLIHAIEGYREYMGMRRDDGLGRNRRLAADPVAWWAERTRSG